ncbi:plastocyanin/azurin family copper-binding protein [Planococcus halotolerans]|uniref:Blue (type 1) copper domain-containing protein n=1 Tax=Planococcus halotolerans TaxID=2233542 RepID=A0A365L0F1_9BACL|nr:plastocyanin/azurin family copper-binding protein [Planococcus halotolerans]RAZ78913.1 hypothetical protein DP120_04670 [Planococcus halotolerans]
MKMKVTVKGKGRYLIASSFVTFGLLAGCGSGDVFESEEANAGSESEQVAVEESEQAASEKSEKADSEEVTDDHVIDIRAFEMGYTPPTITLTKGEEYTLVMKNEGELFHDLTSQDIDVEITYMSEMPDHPEEVSFIDDILGMNKAHAEGDHDGEQGDGHDEEMNALHMNSKPGQTVEIKFIPKEAGGFKFYCSIPGHEEAGMHGMFEVID